MKKIVIIEQKISSSSFVSLVNFSEQQIWDVREAIIKAAFLAFTKSDISIFQTERNTFLIANNSMMPVEFYRWSMQHFFNVQAFTNEEERSCQLSTHEVTSRDIFIFADELLTFRGADFVSVIRKTIKDNIENISDVSLLMSVHSAFIEQIDKL